MKQLLIYALRALSKKAVTLTALSFFFLMLPVSTAKGEAASDLLGKMSCEQVKSLAQDAPAQLFEMWAESGQFGSNSALAKEIIDRGNVAAVLDNIGDLVTIIQGLEEAVNGDPKKVAEIFANWLLGKVLTATGSGVPGAVWTVCTSLNDFAVALNSEMLDSNIRTFAHFAEKDPELLGPNRVDHFLRNFLEMDKSSGGIFDKNYNLTKKRATFLDYAREKLGHKNFPPPAEWEKPENWNGVRAAASSMLQDVEKEVNKRKKFRQLQGELKTQIEQLKREQSVFNTFESLRAQINAMVCQDPPADCISAYTATLNTLEGLIVDVGDIQKTPDGTMNGLNSTIDAINLDLDEVFQKMNQDKLKIEEYCDKGKEQVGDAQQTVNLAKSAAAETAAQVLVASGYRIKACAATTLNEAEDAAQKAQEAADKAARTANNISSLSNDLNKYSAPEPADFAGVEGRLSGLNQDLAALDASIRENLKKKEAFLGAMAKASQQAADLEKKCKGAKELGLVNAAMGRVDQVAAKIPDLRADMNTLASLQSKTGQIQTRISGLKNTEKKNRQCLSGKPDLSSPMKLVQDLSRTAQADIDKAMGHADAAAACSKSLKNKCGPNERLNDEGDCVCKDGYEYVDGECQPKCGPNEARDADGKCDCKAGYEKVNGKCLEKCGPGEERDSSGKCVSACGSNERRGDDGECECIDDYEKINGRCVPICKNGQERDASGRCVSACGKNEVRNSDGECVCRSGYELNDAGKCEPVGQRCEDPSDCAKGYVCINGKCVFQKSDCRRDGCPSGYECNNKTGQCVFIKKPGCTADDECPIGYECNTRTGKCVFIKSDCRRDGCPSGYKCDPKTGQCVFIKTSGCQGDSGCKPGYVCSGGKCVSPFDKDYEDYTNTMGQRDDDRGQKQADQTASDQTSSGGRTGYSGDDLTQDMDAVQDDLKTECWKNSQCPSGYVCKNGRCVKEKGCRKNSECGAGQICKDGECVTQTVQQAALAITPSNKAVILNETVNLKATYTDTDGSTKDVTASASWSPSSTFSKGTIGAYTVTASHKGLTATSQITVVKEKGMDDITVNEKTVTVTFWDHGVEDGDMIDILINGKAEFPGITLKNAHQSRTITLNADIIVVGFRALNVGSISPNTATVTFTSVTSGKPSQTYELQKDQEANMNVTYQP